MYRHHNVLMNRRDAIKTALAGAVSAAIHPAWSRMGRGGIALVARPLGVNLAMGGYSDPQLPFLNVLKQAGSNLQDSVGGAWTTLNGSNADTNEEQYLQLDSDDYVTSLTASPIPSGGQQFTKVEGGSLVNVSVGNGATYAYPSDTYVFMWQGKGTIVFRNSDVSSIANASAGVTISGLQVTSTNAWGTVNSVTLQGSGTGGVIVPTGAGFRFDITAIPDSANYPKAMAIVQSTYLSNYNGGQIFHPNFLAWLRKWPLASLRFMKPQKIEYDVVGGPYGYLFGCSFSANPASGNTSAVLSSSTPIRPGSRTITLSNGQTLTATFTAGSTTVNFSPAVSSNCSSNYFYLHQTNGFSDRSQVSNYSYTLSRGWPLEICCELANALNCSPWINLPVSWGSSDWNSAAGVIQSTLNSSILAYIEGGNEVWNSAYAVQHFALDVSAALWGSGNADSESWYGMTVALMADQFATVFGNPGFDNRIAVQMAGQAANTGVIVDALTTPKWTGNTPPWQRTSASGKKTIKGVAIAPYFGNGSIPSADYTFIQGQGDPVGTFIGSFTANPYAGHTFTSDGSTNLPSGGWFGYSTAQVSSHVTTLSSYGSLPINLYECSQQFGNSSGQETFLISAARDSRMQNAYYTYFADMVSAGCNGVLTIFDFCEAYALYQWGLIESTMQPLAPPPPRMAGAIQWGSGA